MDRGYGKSSRTERNSSRNRSSPYGRDNEEHEGFQDIGETPANSVKVSGQTDVNKLAEQICKACRNDDPPTLLTIGNNSINQAVKGIAVARAELRDDGIELYFQPAFRHENRTKPLIAFYLSTSAIAAYDEGMEETELTVASQSKITPVAGAVAGRIRENKKVFMTAIGVDAVTNSVLAAGNARLFLEKDNLDIKVQPEFTKFEKNGSIVNALRFLIVAESI